jgi:hypothetical protein
VGLRKPCSGGEDVFWRSESLGGRQWAHCREVVPFGRMSTGRSDREVPPGWGFRKGRCLLGDLLREDLGTTLLTFDLEGVGWISTELTRGVRLIAFDDLILAQNHHRVDLWGSLCDLGLSGLDFGWLFDFHLVDL